MVFGRQRSCVAKEFRFARQTVQFTRSRRSAFSRLSSFTCKPANMQWCRGDWDVRDHHLWFGLWAHSVRLEAGERLRVYKNPSRKGRRLVLEAPVRKKSVFLDRFGRFRAVGGKSVDHVLDRLRKSFARESQQLCMVTRVCS